MGERGTVGAVLNTMTQLAKLLEVLKDGRIHTVPELIKKVYGIKRPSSARLAARIYDLRRKGYEIISDSLTHTKWWYQMNIDTHTGFRSQSAKEA